MLHVGVHVFWALGAIHARTLRLRWEGREHWEGVRDRPLILAFCHSDMVCLAMGLRFYGRREARRTTMLSSPSRDGRINGRFMELIGCEVVYGSSAKRPAAALLGLHRTLAGGRRVGLAVDGPLGPRHEAKPGAAHLSKETGAPILPLTVTASSAWTLPDWAGTAVPRPFSTLTVHVAEPQLVDDVEQGTARLTETLRALRPE